MSCDNQSTCNVFKFTEQERHLMDYNNTDKCVAIDEIYHWHRYTKYVGI